MPQAILLASDQSAVCDYIEACLRHAGEDSRLLINGLSLDPRRHELRFAGRKLNVSPQKFVLPRY